MSERGDCSLASSDRSVRAPARRGRWGDRLRTLGWVSVVALLVWVWADMERPSDNDNVEVLLRLPDDSDAVLPNADPKTGGLLVRFTCRGAQGTLKEFVRKLNEDRAQRVYTIQPDPSWQPNRDYTLDTLRLLGQWLALQAEGLQAESPSKPLITVRLDPWEEVEVPVRLRTSDDTAVVDPVLQPATVKIRLRTSALRALGDDPQQPTQTLDLTALDRTAKHAKTVLLARSIRGQPVEVLGDPTVKASFALQYVRTRSAKVTVELIAPPAIWKRVAEKGYIPKLGAEQVDLSIKGDPIEVDKNIDRVRAFVEITAADVDSLGQTLNRPVTVFLPPGLALEGEPPGVDFALIKPPPVTP